MQLKATPLHSMNISIITESSRLQLGEQATSPLLTNMYCVTGVWHIVGAQGIFIDEFTHVYTALNGESPLPVKDPFQMPPLS